MRLVSATKIHALPGRGLQGVQLPCPDALSPIQPMGSRVVLPVAPRSLCSSSLYMFSIVIFGDSRTIDCKVDRSFRFCIAWLGGFAT